MRRKEREVMSVDELVEIIEKCDVCRIAFSNNNIPYIVSMNFGFQFTDEELVLYFHCASAGKKLVIINKNANVCFEMDCSHRLVTGELACNYSMKYESIIGNGLISYITEQDDKIDALNFIMKKYSKNIEFEYNNEHVKNITCLKLMVTEYTGKRSI